MNSALQEGEVEGSLASVASMGTVGSLNSDISNVAPIVLWNDRAMSLPGVGDDRPESTLRGRRELARQQSVVKDFLRLPSMRTPAVKKSRSLRSILRHENPELAVERSMPAGMSHKMLVSKSFVKTRKSSNSPKLVVRRVRFSDDAARKVSRGQGAGWRAWALAEAILPKAIVLCLSWELFAFPLRYALMEEVCYRVALGMECHIHWFVYVDVAVDLLHLLKVMANLKKFAFSKPTTAHRENDGNEKDAKHAIMMELWREVMPMVGMYAFAYSHVWLWRVSLIPRLERIMRLYSYFRNKTKNLSEKLLYLQMYRLVLTVYMAFHWVGCLMFFVARLQGFPATSWPMILQDSLGGNYNNSEMRHPQNTYCLMLFAAADLLTLTGALSHPPNNDVETVLYCFLQLLQPLLMSFALGTIFHNVLSKDEALERHALNMRMLHEFCAQRQLPEETRLELTKHFRFQYMKTREFVSFQSLEMALPREFQVAAADHAYSEVVYRSVVRGGVFFKCSHEFLHELAVRLRENYLQPEEVFVMKGDMGFELSLVIKGCVELTASGKVVKVLDADQPNNACVVGSYAFFLGVQQPYTVRVSPREDAKRLVLSREHFSELLAVFPEHRHIIVENCVWPLGLDTKGNQLEGTHADDVEPDLAAVRDDIMAALRHESIAAMSGLMDAALCGETEEVLRYVRLGQDVNSTNYDGQTALHLAASRGHCSVIEALVQEGADVNVRDRWGFTALQEATLNQEGPAQALLSRWNSSLYVENAACELCTEASAGNVDKITKLLDQGVSPNECGSDKRTALHVAASEGHHKVVTTLIRAGANVNALDRWKRSPLGSAIANRHRAIVSTLSEAGAVLNQSSAATFLCEAASRGDVQQLMLVQACGVDLNVGDYNKRTPLMLACAEQRTMVVNFLISYGAEPNCEDRWGGTAMNDCLRSDSAAITRMLHSVGGRPGTRTPPGVPPSNVIESARPMVANPHLGRAPLRRLGALGRGASASKKEASAQTPSTPSPYSGSRENGTGPSRSGSAPAPPLLQLPMHSTNEQDGSGDGSSVVVASMSAVQNVVSPWERLEIESNDNMEMVLQEHLERASVEGARRTIQRMLEGRYHQILPVKLDMEKLMTLKMASGELMETVLEMNTEFNSLAASAKMTMDALAEIQKMTYDHLTEYTESQLHVLTESCRQNPAACNLLLWMYALNQLCKHMGPTMSSLEEVEVGLSTSVCSLADRRKQGMRRRPSQLLQSKKFAASEWVPSKADLSAYAELDKVSNARAFSTGFEELHIKSEQGRHPAKRFIALMMNHTALQRGLDSLKEAFNSSDARGGAHALSRMSSLNAHRMPRVSHSVSPRESIDNMDALHDSGPQAPNHVGSKKVGRSALRNMDNGTNGLRSGRSSQDGLVMNGSPQLGFHEDEWVSVSNGAIVASDETPIRGNSKHTTACSEMRVTAAHLEKMLLGLGLVVSTDEAHLMLAEAFVNTNSCETDLKQTLSDQSVVTKAMDMFMNQFRHAAPDSSMQLLSLLAHSERLQKLLLTKHAIQKDNLIELQNALELMEQLYQVFKKVDNSAHKDMVSKDTMQIIFSSLSEMGKTMFLDLFPVEFLPEEIPRSTFFILMLQYADLDDQTARALDPDIKDLSGELRAYDAGTRMLAERQSSSGQMLRSKIHSKSTAKSKHEASDRMWGGMEKMSHKELVQQFADRLPSHVLWRIHAVAIMWTLLGDIVGSFINLRRVWVTPIDIMEPRIKAAWTHLQHIGIISVDAQLSAEHVPQFLELVLGDARMAKDSLVVALLLHSYATKRGAGRAITRLEIHTALEREHNDGHEDAKHQETHHVVWWVLLPESKVAKVFEHLYTMCAMYNFVIFPVRIAFQVYEPYHTSSLLWYYDAVELFLDVVLLVFVFIKSSSAQLNAHGVLVTDLHLIRSLYLTHGGALMDILEALPLNWLLWAFGSSQEARLWFRVNRLVQVFRAGAKQIQRHSLNKSVQESNTFLLIFLFSVFHVAACLWFFIGNRAGGWYSTSVKDYKEGQELEVASNFTESNLYEHIGYGARPNSKVISQYLLTFYWVETIMFAYGMVAQLPVRFSEMLVVTIILMIHITLITFIIGQLSGTVMKKEEQMAAVREGHNRIAQFTKSMNLPLELAEKIKQFYLSQMAGLQIDVNHLYGLMSFYSRVKVARFISSNVLQEVSVFKGCSHPFFDALAVLLREVSYQSDETIYAQGQVAQTLFIMTRGSVELTKTVDAAHGVPAQREIVSATGAALGELAFFFNIRHLSTARAMSNTFVIVLTLQREQFQQLMRNFLEDESTMAENCFASFERERTQSRVGSQVGSQHSSDHEDKSEQDIFSEYNVIGKKLMRQVAILRRKRQHSLIMRLCAAARTGRIEELQSLVRTTNINLNLTDQNKRTVMAVAASEGHADIVRWLLDNGADGSICDRYGHNALYDAVRHRQSECAKILREAGVQLDMDKTTAAMQLNDAAAKNDVKTLQYLCENGLDPNSCDYDQRYPLHIAASEGNAEAVKYLLEAGASPTVVDRFGGTPIADAVREGHSAVQLLLYEAGSKMDSMEVAFQFCEAGADGDVDMIRTLCENGADPSIGDYDRRTCLHLAASCGHTDAVDYLIRLGNVDINPVDRFGGTPLDDAYRHGYLVVVTMLQTAGAKRGTDSYVLETLEAKQKLEGRAQLSRVQSESKKMLENARETKRLLAVKGVSTLLSSTVETLMESARLVLEAFSKVFDHRSRSGTFKTPLEDTHALESVMDNVADILSKVQTMVNNVDIHLKPVFIPSSAKQTIYELQLRMDVSLQMLRSIMNTIARLNTEIVNIES